MDRKCPFVNAAQEQAMAEKVWFVTGASRGFGRIWTEAALARGDKVAATARGAATLDDMSRKFGGNVLPLALDVTDHDAVVATVNEAHRHFGRLDAGQTGLFGPHRVLGAMGRCFSF